MNLNEIKTSAREKMTACKMCRVCNGETCRGWTPGPGGKGTGSTFVRNVSKLNEITLNMQILHGDDDVNCSTNLWGHTLRAPIFAAPIANVPVNYGTTVTEGEYLDALAVGCKNAGLLPFYGDGAAKEFFDLPMETLAKLGGYGIPTIKPWVNDIALEKIKRALAHSPSAIAMDVDAAGLISLKKTPTPIAFKTLEDLTLIRKNINVPFIVKGVMTIADAETALNSGADAIVVSNHGGRVMDNGISTVEVLESIVRFVDKRMTVLVDSGFRSGYDVFKALALGADGVLIGRPFSHATIGGQSEGVTFYANQLIAELEDAMRMTGCMSIHDIQRDKINVHF